MRLFLFLAALSALSACSVRAPELDATLSAQSRTAEWPELVPLGPLLAGTDDLDLERSSAVGPDLLARAADLRRRAAILRRLSLP